MLSTSTTRYRDRTWLLILWGAALFLFSIDLGGVPLRDWDEGTVAQVAREIARGDTWTAWLHPQLWGQPYLNKPPLMHSLIAIVFKVFGVHTWAARLPGALLSATSVPLLYLLGREIFPTQLYALLSAGVYLTLLPVVRHGRLAMLDGAIVCFYIALLWFWLRGRRHSICYFAGGLCFALMCLTKGILGLLLLAIALLFIVWDAPKELRSPYLWSGLCLGSLPAVGWYALQWQYYGQQFIDVTLLNQNFERVWSNIDRHQGPPWYYLTELLKYSWPWLIFWPTGLWLAWKTRYQTWAKLLIVWQVAYLLTISVMQTKLPWYIFPVYPAIALTIGVTLTAAWNIHRHWNGRSLSFKRLPLTWGLLLGAFSLLGAAGLFYASPWGGEPSWGLSITFLIVMIVAGAAATCVWYQQTRFIPTLIIGLYGALTVLMSSNHWVWELGESFPVLPVAELVNTHVPAEAPIYIAYGYNRPSLDFYSDRRITAQSPEDLLSRWQVANAMYAIVQDPSPYQATSNQFFELGQTADWHLITNQPQ